MALANNKTKPTGDSALEFINKLENEQKKQDCHTILKYMQEASKEQPVLWGPSLIGFGYVIIKSPSGREVEWFRIGFSPRKANLSLYVNSYILKDTERMTSLGKHKTGQGCLYINKLSDIDWEVLKGIIDETLK